MDELQVRLRDAGRALDAAAPTFDPVELTSGARSVELVPPVPPDDDDAWRRLLARPVVWVGVAAAILLVVVGGAVVLGADRSTVDTGPVAPAPEGGGADPDDRSTSTTDVAEELDVLDVTCDGDATVVSATEVRAAADGVHLRLHNPHPMATVLLDFGDPMSWGGIRPVRFGDSYLVVPIRPGPASLACQVAGNATPAAAVVVIDEQGRWVDPALSCATPTEWDGLGTSAPPYQPSVDEAVRSWTPVEVDTPIRVVRYPGGDRLEVVATTPDGDVSFNLWGSPDGRWMAQPARFCTPAPPQQRNSQDTDVAWYETADLDRETTRLAEQSEQLRVATAAAEPDELVEACATLVQVLARAGDDTVALDPAIAERRAAVVGAIDEAAVFSCMDERGSASAEEVRAQIDAVLPPLLALRDAIDERR